jgi:hypothetical protein
MRKIALAFGWMGQRGLSEAKKTRSDSRRFRESKLYSAKLTVDAVIKSIAAFYEGVFGGGEGEFAHVGFEDVNLTLG